MISRNTMTENAHNEELFHDKKNAEKFPYDIKKLDPDVNKKMLQMFSGERTHFVQIGPKEYMFPSGYEKSAETIYNFEVRPDDTWVVTYPRSGTTMMQEIVWLLANNHDYETAMKLLFNRFPFLESTTCIHPDVKAEVLKDNDSSKGNQEEIEKMCIPRWQTLKDETGKRFIKTHLPLSLLPPNLLTCGCKVIYVARNPKDVVVSYYRLNKILANHGFNGDFPQYADLFMKNLLVWSPYWSHLQEAWEMRHSKNLLFMFYEEMSKDLRQSIKKVSRFLDKDVSEQQLNKLEDHLQIENFQNNPTTGKRHYVTLGIVKDGGDGFIGKGKTSSWKDNASPELVETFNEWIKENLKNTNMPFEFFL